jgi:hypothetical protein
MNLKVGFAHNSNEEEQDNNEDADTLNLTVGSDTDDGKFIAYSAFLSKNETGSPVIPTGPPMSSPVGGDSCTVCGDRASGRKTALRYKVCIDILARTRDYTNCYFGAFLN